VSEPFRILVVCTGNICRSPMAERLLRHELDALLGPLAQRVVVASAGTHGLEGEPMQEYAVRALGDLGAVADGFVARRLGAEHLRDVDVVMTATREHRAHVVLLEPRVVRRAFTLKELGRLCAAVDPAALPDHDPAERGRALITAAAARRGTLPPPPPGGDDIADPYGLAAEHYSTASAEISAALAPFLDLLAGAARRADAQGQQS